MSKKSYKSRNAQVKETIDFVFELLSSNPDGCEMKASDLGFVGGMVVKILVGRGIVERTRMKNRYHSFLYKWVATSAPTKVLYGSVAQELADREHNRYKKHYTPKRQPADTDPDKQEAVDVIDTTVVEPEPEPVYATPLDGFSTQELWDEIKRRGFFIEGERLCIVKKAYLD